MKITHQAVNTTMQGTTTMYNETCKASHSLVSQEYVAKTLRQHLYSSAPAHGDN
eukprot:m.62689 g.62689  ORF g.62689 m.62689 type:complete len:54 (+) comp11922_c0_seq1:50-211(+)